MRWISVRAVGEWELSWQIGLSAPAIKGLFGFGQFVQKTVR